MPDIGLDTSEALKKLVDIPLEKQVHKEQVPGKRT